LKEAGTAYNKGVFPFSANSRARTTGDYEGQVKILAGKSCLVLSYLVLSCLVVSIIILLSYNLSLFSYYLIILL